MLQQRITRRPRRRRTPLECPPLRRVAAPGRDSDETALEDLLTRIEQLVDRSRPSA